MRLNASPGDLIKGSEKYNFPGFRHCFYLISCTKSTLTTESRNLRSILSQNFRAPWFRKVVDTLPAGRNLVAGHEDPQCF